MTGLEKHVLLRHYLKQGMSKRAIARHLGISKPGRCSSSN